MGHDHWQVEGACLLAVAQAPAHGRLRATACFAPGVRPWDETLLLGPLSALSPGQLEVVQTAAQTAQQRAHAAPLTGQLGILRNQLPLLFARL